MSTNRSSVLIAAILIYGLASSPSLSAQEKQGDGGAPGKHFFLGIPGLESLEKTASTAHECVVYRYCEDGGYPYPEPMVGYIDGGDVR